MRVVIVIGALSLVAFGTACAAKSPRAVSGTWELRAPDGSRLQTPLAWLIFAEGTNASDAVMTWPTGVGCQNEYGTFSRGVMDFSRSRYPLIVTFRNSRAATLSFPDEPSSQIALRRVSRTTSIVCE